MKKYLSIIVGLMLVLGASSVFAANDLTLQTSTQISAGATFTVTGNYTMDSITVNADNFTVTLSPGGSLIITAPGGTPITASHSDGITSDRVCSSAESRMQLVAKSTASAETVSVSATGSCGGSSGGTPNTTTTATTDTTTTTTTTTTTPTTTTTTTTTPAATTAATTAVATSAAATTAAATTASTAAVSAWEFRTPLKLGSTGTAVTELQKRLTAEGVYSGPITGYFGPLTQAGVKKYQEQKGIATAGQAGYGNVGPMTRAKLNSSVSASVSTPVVTAPAVQMSSAQVEAIQTQLQALQAQLLLLLSQQLQLLQAGQ